MKLIRLVTLIPALLILSMCFNCRQDDATPQQRVANVLQFRIAEKQDVSYAGTTRMVYRIVLTTETIPTKTTMRATAIALWKNGNTSWKEFTVFMYLPGMDYNSMAYGIGEFTPRGLSEFKVSDFALYGTKWQKP